MLADGVQYAVVPDVVGAVAFVTVTPPAEYPAPDASPVAVYAVLLAPVVAEARYRAALTVSVVGAVSDVRDESVQLPSWWLPIRTSALKLVQIACELAMFANPPN